MKDTLEPSALVIFGVTGNLAQQMLLPALYELERENLLPDKFTIVGVQRRSLTLDEILTSISETQSISGKPIDPQVTDRLKARIRLIELDSTNPEHFSKLVTLLSSLDAEVGVALNHLFYLAIPPDIFKQVISNLASVGLNASDATRASRILVEKPFGNNLDSARNLIAFVSQHFTEEQIFRIDHYLAKETAQNILTFRFSNPLIEGIWSRQFIDQIQITAAEQIGINGRASFYEGMGALRDFVQSHLIQLMAIVMMEYPEDMTPQSIHEQKIKLLQSIEPILPHDVNDVAVRGQYQQYPDEAENPQSNVETYAAIKLEVANPRWGGMPVLLRTGKSLEHKATEIVVVFNDRFGHQLAGNLLIIRIQPNEGISLKLQAKKPGFTQELEPVQMEFCYSGVFNGHHPDAYQRVLIDAMRGDQTLFTTSEEVIASWKLLQPVLDNWQSSSDQPETYAHGSWGPAATDILAGRYGNGWINNDAHVCATHPAPPADPSAPTAQSAPK